MKISLILSSVAIFLHEGIEADSVQVRRRLVNTVPKSGVDVITYLRRKLDSYYDTKSDDTVFLQRKMESIDDADTETVSLMPDDDFTSGSGKTDDQTIEDDEKAYYLIYYNNSKSEGPSTPISGVKNEFSFPSAEAASSPSSNTATGYQLSLDSIGLIVGMVGLVLGSIATVSIVNRRRKEAKKKIMPVRNLVAL